MNSLIGETWQYGCIPMELAKGLTGLEVCRKMIAGEIPLPPIYRVMDLVLLECSEGRTYMRGNPSAEHYNPTGTVHGGWFATMLDASMASAVHTMMPAGVAFTTAEFKTNLIRPLKESSGEVFCEGKVIHLGRTIATSEARLVTADGKLVAHGVETCSILPTL